MWKNTGYMHWVCNTAFLWNVLLAQAQCLDMITLPLCRCVSLWAPPQAAHSQVSSSDNWSDRRSCKQQMITVCREHGWQDAEICLPKYSDLSGRRCMCAGSLGNMLTERSNQRAKQSLQIFCFGRWDQMSWFPTLPWDSRSDLGSKCFCIHFKEAEKSLL